MKASTPPIAQVGAHLVALCLQVGLASAQDNSAAAAEALFQKGRDAMAAEDYETACACFSDSNELDPALGTLFNLALCERERGRTASAWSLYKKVVDKLPAHDLRLPVARQAVTELEARLPRLTVEVSGSFPPGAVISGNELHITEAMLGVELPVDPGEYRLSLEVPGHQPFEQLVQMSEAESKTVVLELGPALPPSPPPSPSPPPLPSPPPSPSPPPLPSPPTHDGNGATQAAKARSAGSRSAGPRAAVSAIPPQRIAPAVLWEDLPIQDFNLSLLYPIALSDTKEQRVRWELGLLYSEVGALDVGVTAGVLSAGEVRGAALAFGATFVRGRTRGIAFCNFFNFATGPLAGFRFAGVANVQLRSQDAQAQSSWGVQFASLGNYVSGDFRGLQIAAVGNVVTDNAEGPQIALFSNTVTGTLAGESIALTNVASELSGVQVGAVNVTAHTMKGAQIALVNVAGDVTGAQIGVVNWAHRVDGVSLGLIPFSVKGGIEPTIWSSTEYAGNVGVGLTSGLISTRLALGLDPNLAPEISLGHEFPVFGFFIKPDIGYRFDFDQNVSSVEAHRFPMRLAFGKKLNGIVGLFGGGGIMLDSNESTDRVEPTPLAFMGASLYL